MKKFLAKGLNLLTLALLLALPAFAQQTADIIGTVTDENGSPLPGVAISVESPALQGTRTTVSNANGSFLVRLLPPGAYVLTAAMTGMETVKQSLQLTVGGSVRPKIAMKPESTAETLVVVAESNSVLDTNQVTANFSSDMVDNLPVNRTVAAITALAPGVSTSGPNGNPVISGAMSYENSFLLNGGVINSDNIRGQASNLYIEDAIQETTVMTGSVSAEYGQFSGGVVNAITKQGGNEFSGSFRVPLTNDDWRARYPTEKQANTELNDKINEFASVTLGGPIIKDRLWFFVAARRERDDSEGETVRGNELPASLVAELASYGIQTETPPSTQKFQANTSDDRLEVKLTAAINPDHTIVASYLKKEVEQTNDDFNGVITLRSLRKSRELPEALYSFNYRGIITPNLTVDALYTKRELSFVYPTGDETTDFVNGSSIIDSNTQNGSSSNYGAHIFGNNTDIRDNENYGVKFSYFWPSSNGGTHDIVTGLSHFADFRTANNFQSPSNWAMYPSATVFQNGQPVPVWLNGNESPSGLYGGIGIWPVLNQSQGAEFAADSFYVNDIWTLNQNWRFSLGFRYDKNDGTDEAGQKVVNDKKISPRISGTYDITGDGKHVISAGYGQYVARISDSGNDGSVAGSPAIYYWYYLGAPTTSPQAVYDWMVQQYGANFFERQRALETADFVNEPGASTVIGDLGSPYSEEFTIGYSTRFGSKGWAKFDVVSRDYKDFYVSRVDTTTGDTPDGNGDLAVVGNDNELYERTYRGLQGQLAWNFTDKFTVGGNFTLSKTEGNIEGETRGSGGTTATSLTQYPEFNNFANRSPVGPLQADVPYQMKAWAGYKLNTVAGDLNFTLYQRFEDGKPYTAAFTIPINAAYGFPSRSGFGYNRPPTTTTYTVEQGGFRTESWSSTDIAIGWSMKVRKLEFFANFDLTNVFNGDAIVDSGRVNTTASRGVRQPDGTTTVTPFNVYTETPVLGTHYSLGSTFGTSGDFLAYQLPRRFRLDFGLRF